jgi:hypothetical protein
MGKGEMDGWRAAAPCVRKPEGGVVPIQPDLREFRVRSPSRTFPKRAYLDLAIVYSSI